MYCRRIIPGIVLACLFAGIGACWYGVDQADPSAMHRMDRMQREGEGVIVHGHIVDAYHIYRHSLKLLDEQGQQGKPPLR